MVVVKQYTAADVEGWRHLGIPTAAGLARVAEYSLESFCALMSLYTPTLIAGVRSSPDDAFYRNFAITKGAFRTEVYKHLLASMERNENVANVSILFVSHPIKRARSVCFFRLIFVLNATNNFAPMIGCIATSCARTRLSRFCRR